MSFRGRAFNRRHFLRLAAGATVAAGAAAWHALLYSPTHPEVTFRRVAVRGVPGAFRGMRIVQLSDLHYSSMVSRAFLEKCVAMANALEPDVVFLTGDFLSIDRSRAQRDQASVAVKYGRPLSEILAGLRAREGAFAVLGNHDTTIDAKAVAAAVDRAGIRVLRDEAVYLSRGESRLAVAGLADFGTEWVNQEQAFAGLDPEEPALIMMHHPDLFELGMRHRNGLIFSGHTHGGQVLFPLVGPLYVPSRFGDRFLKGRFVKGGLTMIVNRGLGVIRVPARLNCPPEIALVTLG